MAPSETAILSNFLLAPAPLPTIMSLQHFTELFPKRLRSHPHIRVLYRELQEIREQDMDLVNENIDKETVQGDRQKAELRKSLMKTGIDGMSASDQREMDMDVELFGQTNSMSDYHSVPSLLDAMQAACSNVEREVAEVDREASSLLSNLNDLVGDLSDLRYGKMQGPAGTTGDEVVNEAIRGLQNLENATISRQVSRSRQPHPSTMPSITLHPRASRSPSRVPNPLPQLLQTPSGLALLELQGTINIPSQDEATTSSAEAPDASVFETPIGKLMFPDYSPQDPADDTAWMKRVYLYVGRYQRITGEVKKLPKPLAIVQRRAKPAGSAGDDADELEVVEVVRYKIYFKSRPEPVNDI
ncbi:uncharacterized protein BO97DRAFT_374133 [Aspergillus homomorphus CBS 101889]|uniref:Ctf8-domain-containing protein n=1 Tax=Aspergillus homomorphus (strain CBS 101889) TaxID=1450537 RepID=A0A395HQ38_ASPHC|nr:hypothetical protein BO97DRAFT_374133 [Aspergillus homomorphus CBS 101889]RAL09726.1 hypothetical protein BO97DRAFT_374133 [Aspergillus homomorphus CBS 101889]